VKERPKSEQSSYVQISTELKKAESHCMSLGALIFILILVAVFGADMMTGGSVISGLLVSLGISSIIGFIYLILRYRVKKLKKELEGMVE